MIAGIYFDLPYSGWSFTHIFTVLWDFIVWIFWKFINIIYMILDAEIEAFNSFIDGSLLEQFINIITSKTAIFRYSVFLGLMLVLLFGAWAIIKRNIEPDKAPPLQSIVWEIGKCVVIIVSWTFIFTTVINLTLALQDDITTAFNTECEYDENGDLISCETATSSVSNLAGDILLSFITTNDDGDLTSDYLKASLALDDGVCSADETDDAGNLIVNFWGCHGGYSSYNKNIAAIPLWRGSVQKSLAKSASTDDDYLLEYNSIILIAGMAVMVVAVFYTLMSLVTRLFELVILFIIAPAVIGTSICRQEVRQTLWKSLASLALQAAGTLLTFYVCIRFLNVITDMSAGSVSSVIKGALASVFSNGNTQWLVLVIIKFVLICGVGLIMTRGSKMIQSFISDSAGMDFQSMNALKGVIGSARKGLGFGVTAGKAIAKAPLVGAGTLAKAGSGASSLGHAIKTRGAAKAVQEANENAITKGGDISESEQKERNDAISKYANAKESANRQNSDGSLKPTVGNALSRAGDKLLGVDKVKKKQGITPQKISFSSRKADKVSSSTAKANDLIKQHQPNSSEKNTAENIMPESTGNKENNKNEK